MSELPELAQEGRHVLVVTDDEPEFAHVYGIGPAGDFEPLVDVHLTCGGANAFTVRVADGTFRHVCRDCALKAATKKG